MRFCRNAETTFQSRVHAIGVQYGRRHSLLARLRQVGLME